MTSTEGEIGREKPKVEPGRRFLGRYGVAEIRRMVIVLALASLIGFATIFYLFCPIANEKMFDEILFLPQNVSPTFKDFAAYGLAEPERVTIKTSDGVRLTGWFFKNSKEKHAVVISHGQAGDMTYMLNHAKPIFDLDNSVLVYNYRGYADSEGTPTIAGICQDGLAAFDYLVNERKIAPDRIVTMGVSLGSGVACDMLQFRQPAGIILQSGYTSLKKAAEERTVVMSMFPQFLYPKNGLDNAAILKRAVTPLLVIHGSVDRCFPIHHARELYASGAGPKQICILDGCGHGRFPWPRLREYREALAAFFAGLK